MRPTNKPIEDMDEDELLLEEADSLKAQQAAENEIAQAQRLINNQTPALENARVRRERARTERKARAERGGGRGRADA